MGRLDRWLFFLFSLQTHPFNSYSPLLWIHSLLNFHQSNIDPLPSLSEPAAGRRQSVLLDHKARTVVPLQITKLAFRLGLEATSLPKPSTSLSTGYHPCAPFGIHKNVNNVEFVVSSGVSHKISYHFSMKLMPVLVSSLVDG